MSEEFSGPEADDAAAATDDGLAERLIRDEFSDAAPLHHAWFHREDTAGGEATETEAPAGHELVPVAHGTAKVQVVGAEGLAEETIVVGASIIHEEFAPPRAPRSRSHRGGMLAGLGVVGALLAVLVLLAPGGSTPRLPAQSVHDVSPVTASGPRTDAATTPSTAAPTTTSSPPASTTTPQPHQNETITTFITYSLVPGTPAAAPAGTASVPTPTAPPATTTTTAPPPTTTTPTTAPRHCILGLIC